MSKSAISLLVFGVYVLVAGLVFLLAPEVILLLPGITATPEVWIRVVGMLMAYLGGYYLLAARAELLPLIRLSVYTRASFILALAALVVLAGGPRVMLLFGVVDLLGAIWTGLALRHEGRA